ncbi:MAG: hypothetical protein A2252_05475 [Elusimicrobia bacterium RIFOXYA2_FULL_39_19]|nr:MAG: hypothetical protein A2252_05475 [Elusimicrobia bacterium RIFOXYA2_FULL_39_19]
MPIVVLLMSFAVYLFTLSPSIAVGDSGEFCASAQILGLPHSPGYPLYCLLGKILINIVPLGSLAFRVNLQSAFFSALTVMLMYFLLLKITQNKPVSVITALLFAFSKAFWQSAVQSEVFALNTFFVIILLYLLYLSITDDKYLLLSAFLFGLGMGNHHTLIFITPVFLLVLFKRFKFKISKYPVIQITLLFILGFTIYAYLPIRTLKNPSFDWGNPENINNFLRVISRKDYGSFSLTVGEKQGLDFITALKQVKRYALTLSGQLGILTVFAGFAGWLMFIKKEKYYGFANLIVFLGAGIGFILLANLPFDALSEGIFERFYVLPAVPFILSVGFLADYVYKKNKIFILFFAVIAVFVFVSNITRCNWRNYYLEHDYAKNILKTLKPNSVFFMDGGDDTFYGMGYMCFALNKRPDIELHDRGGVVFKSAYGADFRSLSSQEKETRRNRAEYILSETRPLTYSTFNKEVLPGKKLYLNGILYDTQKPLFDSWALYSLRSAYVTYPDYRSRALAPVYTFVHSEAESDPYIWLDYSVARFNDCLWLKSNVLMVYIFKAYDYLVKKDYDKAELYYTKSLTINSKDTNALIGLGVVAEKKNDNQKAIQCYLKAIAINLRSVDAYYNLGAVYWKEGNWEKVAEYFSKTLEINPDHAQARAYLPKVLEKLKQNQ